MVFFCSFVFLYLAFRPASCKPNQVIYWSITTWDCAGLFFYTIYNLSPAGKKIYLFELEFCVISLLRCRRSLSIPSICVHRRVGLQNLSLLWFQIDKVQIRFLETEKRLMQLLNYFITAHLLLQSQVGCRVSSSSSRLFRLVLDDITSPLLAMVTSSVNEEYFPPYQFQESVLVNFFKV